MSRLRVVRAAWGVLQLIAPGLVADRLGGTPLDRRGRNIARVLASRQLLQTAVCGPAPPYAVLALGAEVDGLHAASMIGVGMFASKQRRAAFGDALVAGAFAAAGVMAARASRSARRSPGPTAGLAELRDRSADRLARRLVPGYRRAGDR
ncbi:MAG: hypothetical protein M3137_02150 [Actinomycetota bacterium]|nr:hypothetical protein [Actinomycetota bacterium]